MRHKNPIRLTAIAAGICLFAGAAVAVADERLRADANDSPGRLDIRQVNAGHSTDGRLRHVIDTFGRWTPADLVARGGAPGAVCLQIWTKRRPSAGQPDYLACANADRTGRELQGWLTRVSRRAGRTGRSVPLVISRPNTRSLVMRFSEGQIGGPDRYYWRAETVYYADGCPADTGCVDTAPDRPRASSHILKAEPPTANANP